MKLILLLFFVFAAQATETHASVEVPASSVPASYLKQQLSWNPAFSMAAQAQIRDSLVFVPQSALFSLVPRKKPFTVDYGNGALTNRLEQATLELLSYPLISNIVGTFSDEVETTRSQGKFRFLLNLNRKELRVAYLF